MSFLKMCLFILGCAEFIAVHRLSLVAGAWGGGGTSPQLGCLRASRWPLLLQGPRGHVGSEVLVQGLHCFKACGLFLDQGSHPRPLPWQADS